MTEAHEKESPADSNDSLMHALSPVSNALTSGAPSCNQKQLASGKADGMESFQDASDDRLLVCVAKGDFNAPVISYSGHREIKPLAPEGDEEDQTIWHEIIAKSVPHPNGQGWAHPIKYITTDSVHAGFACLHVCGQRPIWITLRLGAVRPFLRSAILVMQTDMTIRAKMEAALAEASEVQLSMLSNIFPR